MNTLVTVSCSLQDPNSNRNQKHRLSVKAPSTGALYKQKDGQDETKLGHSISPSTTHTSSCVQSLSPRERFIYVARRVCTEKYINTRALELVSTTDEAFDGGSRDLKRSREMTTNPDSGHFASVGHLKSLISSSSSSGPPTDNESYPKPQEVLCYIDESKDSSTDKVDRDEASIHLSHDESLLNPPRLRRQTRLDSSSSSPLMLYLGSSIGTNSLDNEMTGLSRTRRRSRVHSQDSAATPTVCVLRSASQVHSLESATTPTVCVLRSSVPSVAEDDGVSSGSAASSSLLKSCSLSPYVRNSISYNQITPLDKPALHLPIVKKYSLRSTTFEETPSSAKGATLSPPTSLYACKDSFGTPGSYPPVQTKENFYVRIDPNVSTLGEEFPRTLIATNSSKNTSTRMQRTLDLITFKNYRKKKEINITPFHVYFTLGMIGFVVFWSLILMVICLPKSSWNWLHVDMTGRISRSWTNWKKYGKFVNSMDGIQTNITRT